MWLQLETVYVLEGLGPPKDQAAASRTFADQASMLPSLLYQCTHVIWALQAEPGSLVCVLLLRMCSRCLSQCTPAGELQFGVFDTNFEFV